MWITNPSPHSITSQRIQERKFHDSKDLQNFRSIQVAFIKYRHIKDMMLITMSALTLEGDKRSRTMSSEIEKKYKVLKSLTKH